MGLLRKKINDCSLGLAFRRNYERNAKFRKATKRVEDLVDKIEGTCEPIKDIDKQALIEKVRKFFQKNELNRLTSKELSLVFMLNDQSLPLHNDMKLLTGLLEAIKEKEYPGRCVKAVRIFYLVSFDTTTSKKTATTTKCLAGFLIEAINSKKPGIWSELHKEYKLFDADEAYKQLAQKKIKIALENKDTERWLVRILQYSGIGRAAFKETCKRVKTLKTKVDMPHINLLISWSCNENNGLLYPNCRGDLADALLLAWKEKSAPSEVVEVLLKFFDTHYGNPKIERNHWHGVSLISQQVLIRWIGIKTLDLFLEVIKKTVTGQGREQWKYRRAFWISYINKNYVSDIWVVFGGAGHRYIEGRKALNHLQYGRLRGSAPDQAVLLLQVGDLMIADWSHNGKARGWRQNNTSPSLSGQDYQADELRGLRKKLVFEIIHHSSTFGGWQEAVARKIEYYTKIEMPYSEYMPK